MPAIELLTRTTILLVASVLLAVVIFGTACYQSSERFIEVELTESKLVAEVVLENLEIPWDMDWANDGWIWFSEKNGQISRFSLEDRKLQRIHRIEEVYQSKDNSGLHALGLHLEFPVIPYVYVHYTYSKKRSRLARYRFDVSSIELIERTVLLDEIPANVTHNGSRIVFSADGSAFYLTLGDAYRAKSAQDPDQLVGKILRLDANGAIPSDNPFPGSPVWSYGHRNPQGLVLASNGRLYSSEHGGKKDDELNVIKRGGNYGHPDVRGFCDLESEKEVCREKKVVEPLMVWSPTYAVSGIEYYDHEAIPEWRGSILVVSLKKDGPGGEGQRLQQLRLNEKGDRVLEVNDYLVGAFGRLREVMMAPDGRVFLFTSNRELNWNRPSRIHPRDDRMIMLRNPAYKSHDK